jgi:hypothetical protein
MAQSDQKRQEGISVALTLVQDSLHQNGYDVGVIDGVWGEATERAFEELMASERYRRHAPTWTWAHEVSVGETLFFLTSDAYP